MGQQDPYEINRLIGRFADLQERWENNPDSLDWTGLQELAREGAHAYNEGAGPSFHALALDGVLHTEFHERFLDYSLQAGFDPFKLARASTSGAEVPVIDHASLADSALSNPSSARMRAKLMELARRTFEPLLLEVRKGKPASSLWMFRVAEACVESIPLDMVEEIAPELAKPHRGEGRRQDVDPIEGYLSDAEAIVESNTKPYG